MVRFASDVPAGTIVVRTAERLLYLVLENQTALRYPVAVGRAGRAWTGISAIEGKFIAPNWAPPPKFFATIPIYPM